MRMTRNYSYFLFYGDYGIFKNVRTIPARGGQAHLSVISHRLMSKILLVEDDPVKNSLREFNGARVAYIKLSIILYA